MTVCESEPELDLLNALVLDPSLAWTRGLSVGLCEQESCVRPSLPLRAPGPISLRPFLFSLKCNS